LDLPPQIGSNWLEILEAWSMRLGDEEKLRSPWCRLSKFLRNKRVAADFLVLGREGKEWKRIGLVDDVF